MFSAALAVLLFLSSTSESSEPILQLDEPELMDVLQSKGLSFGELIDGPEVGDASNRELAARRPWSSIVGFIQADLAASKRKDPKLGPSMTHVHRLFDHRWLSSSEASFELVGVVNRLDRAPFADHACGEIRLLYRLAYLSGGAQGVYSRLPMTVNVVFWAFDSFGKKDCRQAAKPWFLEQPDAAALTSESGPLSPRALSRERLKSVELNLQSVRWPSTIRPDMGGHAEYLLRVFHRLPDGRFAPSTLENTPDVERVGADPKLRAELLSWLRAVDNVRAAEQGIVVVPEKFLAKRATSFALHGTARLANRPYSRLFSVADLRGATADPDGLLRRLNDMSCIGCHQARTVAGFHFLGKDRAKTIPINAILAPNSPHALRDAPRRQRFVKALVEGRADPRRPLSERAQQGEGGYGSHCGLNSREWTCDEGLICRSPDGDRDIGECLPREPSAGDPCEFGRMSQDADPHRDRMATESHQSCGATRHCETTSVGFPGGMCSGGCLNLVPGEVCGSIAVLQGFNDCLSKGDAFADCLSRNVRPGALRSCDADKNPCRDDYICSRTTEGAGACIPPYFLFQLRVDGHPTPKS